MDSKYLPAHSALKSLLLAVLCLSVLVPGSCPADPPPTYYDTVDETSAATLRATLHAVIDGHTRYPYTSGSTDTWDILNRADEDPFDAGRILDLYQNRTFTKHSGGNNDYNREHTWPKSYGFPDDSPSNKPYTDCHHLLLCDIGYNGDRGSRIFDDCLSGCSVRVTDTYNGQNGQNEYKDASPVGIWETWIGRRGDVARAMFYMDVRYEGDAGSEPDLILTDDPYLIVSTQTGNNESVAYMGLLATLLRWHDEDPVDDLERDRTDWVFAYQGNRNPFIDHPEWVDAIFDPNSGVEPPGSGEVPTGITEVYPNPFNPSTRIVCSLAEAGPVQLAVYSLDGKRVRTLTSGRREAGEFEVRWDGTDHHGDRVASGLYFCRLSAGGRSDTQKLMMLK